MPFYEHIGSVLQSSSDIPIFHCVSRNMRLGAGFAVFMRKQNLADLKRQNRCVGDVAVGKQDNRIVFNLVTKDLHYHKPRLSDVRLCLAKLLSLCKKLNVKVLAGPAIASGLDGKPWPVIRQMLIDVFSKTGVHVHIYHLKKRK